MVSASGFISFSFLKLVKMLVLVSCWLVKFKVYNSKVAWFDDRRTWVHIKIRKHTNYWEKTLLQKGVLPNLPIVLPHGLKENSKQNIGRTSYSQCCGITCSNFLLDAAILYYSVSLHTRALQSQTYCWIAKYRNLLAYCSNWHDESASNHLCDSSKTFLRCFEAC